MDEQTSPLLSRLLGIALGVAIGTGAVLLLHLYVDETVGRWSARDPFEWFERVVGVTSGGTVGYLLRAGHRRSAAALIAASVILILASVLLSIFAGLLPRGGG